jgi:hypothetical protein
MRDYERRDGVSSVSSDFQCRHCKMLVYWAPGWLADGSETRKLFSTVTKRPHDCTARPDPDAFDVIEE